MICVNAAALPLLAAWGCQTREITMANAPVEVKKTAKAVEQQKKIEIKAAA